MTYILTIITLLLIITSQASAWDVNKVTLQDRIDIISRVMGKYSVDVIDDSCVSYSGHIIKAPGLTIVVLTWRRNGYEVVTTATVPIPSHIVRRNITVYNDVITTTAYITNSTFTIRRIPKPQSLWSRSIGTWK